MQGRHQSTQQRVGSLGRPGTYPTDVNGGVRFGATRVFTNAPIAIEYANACAQQKRRFEHAGSADGGCVPLGPHVRRHAVKDAIELVVVRATVNGVAVAADERDDQRRERAVPEREA